MSDPQVASADEAHRFIHGVAIDALNIARKTEREQAAHEDLCAERYGHIAKEIGELKSIFKWAGGALFTLLLAAFGFLINQTMSSNKSLQDQSTSAAVAASRIDILQQALQDERRRNAAPPMPQQEQRP